MQSGIPLNPCWANCPKKLPDLPIIITMNEMAFNTVSDWKIGMLEQVRTINEDTLNSKDVCHIMLTGGRSAKQFYEAWAASGHLPANFSKLRFYFGDERCVPSDHPESNYRLASEALFPQGIPDHVRVHRMETDCSDLEGAAARYAAVLPDCIDILLLSMGEDGHIASLFPHSQALKEANRRVVAVRGPKLPYERMTITPPVIRNARHVFVMALGPQKRMVYEQALRNPSDIDTLPARLVVERSWIFGD